MEQLAKTVDMLFNLVLQQQAQERVTPVTKSQLAPFDGGENMGDFLLAFERTMKQKQIDEEEWPVQIEPLLTGKASGIHRE